MLCSQPGCVDASPDELFCEALKAREGSIIEEEEGEAGAMLTMFLGQRKGAVV